MVEATSSNRKTDLFWFRGTQET